MKRFFVATCFFVSVVSARRYTHHKTQKKRHVRHRFGRHLANELPCENANCDAGSGEITCSSGLNYQHCYCTPSGCADTESPTRSPTPNPTLNPTYPTSAVFQNQLYTYVADDPVTWEIASDRCHNIVGHSSHDLAKVNSSEIESFILNTFGLVNTDWWLGCNDRENEGDFVWMDGTSCNKFDSAVYSRWADGEPDGSSGQDCTLSRGIRGDRWIDMSCIQDQEAYVCSGDVDTDPPTATPTKSPTSQPTQVPTKSPTSQPTQVPTKSPTSQPTLAPTQHPTFRSTCTTYLNNRVLPDSNCQSLQTVVGFSENDCKETCDRIATCNAYDFQVTPKICRTFSGQGAPCQITADSSTNAYLCLSRNTNTPTTAPPTLTPTDAPTETPTLTPTDSPTDTPTVAPTDTPTVEPTLTPTLAPTNATVVVHSNSTTLGAGVIASIAVGGTVIMSAGIFFFREPIAKILLSL